MTFEMGQIYVTRGIGMLIGESDSFRKFISISFTRYANQDWGDLCDEDKAMNDHAVQYSDGRIVGRYNNALGDIYIITEWDRSLTTILLTEEY